MLAQSLKYPLRPRPGTAVIRTWVGRVPGRLITRSAAAAAGAARGGHFGCAVTRGQRLHQQTLTGQLKDVHGQTAKFQSDPLVDTHHRPSFLGNLCTWPQLSAAAPQRGKAAPDDGTRPDIDYHLSKGSISAPPDLATVGR